MKLLMISDLHGANDVLDKMEKQFSEADAVVFAGDFAVGLKPETSKEALEKMCSKHENIFAVLGNCDNEDFLEELENADVCVENALVFHEGLAFAGSGGALKWTGETEFEREEDEMLADFDIVKNSVEQTGDKSLWKNLILVSHNPPLGKIVDTFDGEHHVGSQKLTDFINENQPLAVVCGHIHEGVGIEKFGETYVVNPGSLGDKQTYVWMEIEKNGDGWKVISAEVKEV